MAVAVLLTSDGVSQADRARALFTAWPREADLQRRPGASINNILLAEYRYTSYRLSMSHPYAAALPIANVVLRILIVLNWLSGAAILALLTATIVAEPWTMSALGISPSSEIRRLIMPLRAIAALGLVAIPLYDAVFRRLVAIVETVRGGDPFVAANARRLQAIAWALVALQVLSLVIGGIAEAVSTPAFPLNVDAGFSAGGWLAVLLTFVVARVFAEGTGMREDLEGTV